MEDPWMKKIKCWLHSQILPNVGWNDQKFHADSKNMYINIVPDIFGFWPFLSYLFQRFLAEGGPKLKDRDF